MNKKPIAVDLFAGCGGLTLGLRKAGYNVVAAIEIDDLAVETYRQNHPGVAIHQCDITRLPVTRFLRLQKLKRGQVDLLAGCPPCQGFSTLTTLNGHRRGRDSRNELIFQFVRYVRGLRPKTIMMENVPGLANDSRLCALVDQLQSLGYKIRHAVLNAADFGTPQNRRRFILVGSRVGEVDFAPKTNNRRTVRWAFEKTKGVAKDPLHFLPEGRSPRIRALIRSIPRNGGSRSALPPSKTLQCHRGFDGFRDVYGRMSWDQPAPTITGGCCNPSKGRFLHPIKNRCITLREAALLQGFPSTYKFSLRRGKFAAAQMIGNALPPEFIRRHAAVLKAAAHRG